MLTVAGLFKFSLSRLNQENRLVLWEPLHLLLFQLVENDWLHSIEITYVFKFQVNDEVDIVPNVMVEVNVVVESFLSVSVKLKVLVKR